MKYVVYLSLCCVTHRRTHRHLSYYGIDEAALIIVYYLQIIRDILIRVVSMLHSSVNVMKLAIIPSIAWFNRPRNRD